MFILLSYRTLDMLFQHTEAAKVLGVQASFTKPILFLYVLNFLRLYTCSCNHWHIGIDLMILHIITSFPVGLSINLTLCERFYFRMAILRMIALLTIILHISCMAQTLNHTVSVASVAEIHHTRQHKRLIFRVIGFLC